MAFYNRKGWIEYVRFTTRETQIEFLASREDLEGNNGMTILTLRNNEIHKKEAAAVREVYMLSSKLENGYKFESDPYEPKIAVGPVHG